jgi:hypothetical protein
MWCLSKPSGERTFHATRAAAEAAAGADQAIVVWFDSFDYERHNPGETLTRLRIVADAERAIGLAYVAGRIEELRRRWVDPWGPEAAS